MKNLLFALLLAFLSFTSDAQVQIEAAKAKEHYGEVVTLCGKIYSGRYLENANNQPTLLNLGGEYPKQLVTIAIFQVDRKNFPFKPETYYPNTEVCVTGKLIEFRGSPEIIVQNTEQIKLQITGAKNAENAATAIPAKNVSKPKKSPVSEVPKTNAPAPTAQDQYDITLTGDVNLRSGPGTDFDVATVLRVGSIVTVLKSANGWSLVSIRKQAGSAAPAAEKGYINNTVLK